MSSFPTRRTFPKIYVATFVVMLIFDQWLKAWVRTTFDEHQVHAWPFPGVFELTLTYNKGIAFGMLQGMGVLFVPIALLITGSAAAFTYKNPQEPRWTHFAMGLLAAGAIGNLIDRVWLGKVTDMFFFRAINFPVFNLADSCITVAAILIAIRFLFEKAPTPSPAKPDYSESV